MQISTKTLASLAILKVNWDLLKRDHIETFVPLIMNLLQDEKYQEEINLELLRQDFRDVYGLVLPHFPLITILNRATKRSFLKREFGNYYVIKNKLPSADFSLVSEEQFRKLNQVISEFHAFVEKNYGMKDLNKQEVEVAFLQFIKDEDLSLVFGLTDDNEPILPEIKVTENSSALQYLVAKFIKWAKEENNVIFGFIVDLSIGQILAHTILHENLSSFSGRLNKANFYLDVAFLFNTFGINGQEMKSIYDDFLLDLKEEGANLYIFQHTYKEFITILENCLRNFDRESSFDGRLDTTKEFFIENDYSSSDIEMFIARAQKDIKAMGVTIIEKPGWDEHKYNISEKDLHKEIVKIYFKRDPLFREVDYAGRIRRDIDSISAIARLRGGDKPNSLVGAKHTLITTNAGLAKACYNFSNNDEVFSIPPCLHDRFVGTLIWLGKPTKVTQINERKIMADAYAALRPSPDLIKHYFAKIIQLKKKGLVSDEDYLILRSDRIARNLLQEETFGVVSRLTDQVPLKILEEVRADIKKDETRKLLLEKESHRKTQEEIRVERERRILIEDRLGSIIITLSRMASWIIFGVLVIVNGIILNKVNSISIIIIVLAISVLIEAISFWFREKISSFITSFSKKHLGIT